MPFYEYVCADCEAVTEVMRSMEDADETPTCEHCGSEKTARKISLFMTASDATPEMPSGGGCCSGGACGCH